MNHIASTLSLVTLTSFSILMAPAYATILYSENFSSGNAARDLWQEGPNADKFDASSGDYVLKHPDGETGLRSRLTGVPELRFLRDTSVRAQVRLNGESNAVGLIARDDGVGTVSYAGFFDNNARQLVLGWNSNNFTPYSEVDFEFDLNARDLILQLDVIGGDLSLWAWPAGGAMPDQPQLTATDSRPTRAFQGAVNIFSIPNSPGLASTATFRYILVGDSSIPEPSTLCMITLAGGVLMTRCRTRAR